MDGRVSTRKMEHTWCIWWFEDAWTWAAVGGTKDGGARSMVVNLESVFGVSTLIRSDAFVTLSLDCIAAAPLLLDTGDAVVMVSKSGGEDVGCMPLPKWCSKLSYGGRCGTKDARATKSMYLLSYLRSLGREKEDTQRKGKKNTNVCRPKMITRNLRQGVGDHSRGVRLQGTATHAREGRPQPKQLPSPAQITRALPRTCCLCAAARLLLCCP